MQVLFYIEKTIFDNKKQATGQGGKNSENVFNVRADKRRSMF